MLLYFVEKKCYYYNYLARRLTLLFLKIHFSCISTKQKVEAVRLNVDFSNLWRGSVKMYNDAPFFSAPFICKM